MQLWNKQKTSVFANSWRRSRVILIEKHFKPICSKITSTTHPVTIRKRWFVKCNVELFEVCETIPKVQCSECLLYWNQGVICCTCGHLLVESESSHNFSHWRLDALSIPHYVIVKVENPRCSARQKRRSERAFCDPQRAQEMYQKEFWWNSRSFPTRSSISWFATQSWLDRGEVHRNGQIGTGRSLLLPIFWGIWEISGKLVYLTEQIGQECTDETRIRLPTSSLINEPSPPRIWRRTTRTNPFSSIPKVAFVFFFQFFMVAVESKLVELMIFFICCSRIVYSWWQSAATDGGVEQYTSHVTFFSCLCALIMMSHTTLAEVFVRVISSMCHAPECLISLRPSLRTLHLSLPSSTSSSWTLTSLPCGCCRSKISCALRPMRSLALWPITPFSQFSEWEERKKSRAERCRCACHPLQTHILHTFSFILVSA